MASSAMEIRSPAVSSMSSSRPGGSGLTWLARSSSSSVVSPIAETTTTTSSPALRAATMRSATRLIRSASATEDPPYFCTTSATTVHSLPATLSVPTPPDPGRRRVSDPSRVSGGARRPGRVIPPSGPAGRRGPATRDHAGGRPGAVRRRARQPDRAGSAPVPVRHRRSNVPVHRPPPRGPAPARRPRCSPCRRSWPPAPRTSRRRPAPRHRRPGAGRGGRRARRAGRAWRRRPRTGTWPPGTPSHAGRPGPDGRGDQRERRHLAGRRAGLGRSGGTADVSLAATADGLFQCALPSADPAGAGQLRTPRRPRRRRPAPARSPGAAPVHRLAGRAHRPAGPARGLPGQPPAGATGTCYSVESTSASLNAPLDVGIYCYDRDGTPTAVRTDSGMHRRDPLFVATIPPLGYIVYHFGVHQRVARSGSCGHPFHCLGDTRPECPLLTSC